VPVAARLTEPPNAGVEERWEGLPPRVQEMLIEQHQREMREAFECQVAACFPDLVDGFLELDDVRPIWDDYIELQWRDWQRQDESWDDFLAEALASAGTGNSLKLVD
jgi:hypothetical protein